MKKSRFSEEQIAYALRQVESGTPVGDVCRQVGVSEATFYVWKKKYAHLGVSEMRRLRQLEEETSRLKRVVADLTLDKHMLAEALRKKTRNADPAAHDGGVVPDHVWGQLCAGVSAGTVQSGGVVPEEPREGSIGPPVAEPGDRSGPAAVRLPPGLRPAPAPGLAGECEAGTAAVSPRGPAGPAPRAEAAPPRAASRPGARADGTAATLEHGFCA